MDKLAALTGYTPGSASGTLSKIKQKIKMVGSGAPATPLTPKKPAGAGRAKTASSAKRGATKVNNDEASHPRRSARSPPRKLVMRGLDVDDDEEDFVSAGVKKEHSPEEFDGYGFYDQAREAAGFGVDEEEI